MTAAGVAGKALIAGVVVLAASYLLSRFTQDGSRRFWLSYVHNFAFFLSLSLGALFFVVLQHLTRSGWSVVVRRPAEIVAANLLVLAAMFVPIAFIVAGGSGTVYPWAKPASAFAHLNTDQDHATTAHASAGAGVEARLAAYDERNVTSGHAGAAQAEDHARAHEPSAADHDDHAAHDALIAKKRAYLNAPFFILRWIAYFAVWAGLGWWFWTRSMHQDASGDVALTHAMQRRSAPAMLLFALTVTLASFDLLMSLDPVWFSTIFGVYFFSGCAVGFFALLIVTLAGLQKGGVLTRSVTPEHYHDLGKLLFAFVFFWGYIAFSQYMLIWYGNIPEETGWFFRRGCATQAPNVWSYVIVLILLGHFLLPFVALLSRNVKRHRRLLVFWAVWMLVLHWVDLYWLVMPQLTTQYLPLGVVEIGCLAGLGAVFFAGLARLGAGRSLLAVGDPRLNESLAFENM